MCCATGAEIGIEKQLLQQQEATADQNKLQCTQAQISLWHKQHANRLSFRAQSQPTQSNF